MNLANRIKRRMSELQLTQEMVANRAGISQGMVYKLVSGKVKNTSKLVDLARALECDLEWLATGGSELREQSASYLTDSNLTVRQLKMQLDALPRKAKKAVLLELISAMIDDADNKS